MDFVAHVGGYFNASILDGDRPACNAFQLEVSSSLGSSAQARTRRSCGLGSDPAIRSMGVDAVDANVVLVIRMKVWEMMRPSGFDEHSDHDSEESRDFGHF
jgi:hypothetical protein